MNTFKVNNFFQVFESGEIPSNQSCPDEIKLWRTGPPESLVGPAPLALAAGGAAQTINIYCQDGPNHTLITETSLIFILIDDFLIYITMKL